MRDPNTKYDIPAADTPTNLVELQAKRYLVLKPLLDRLIKLEYGDQAVLDTGSDLDVYIELLSRLISKYPNNKEENEKSPYEISISQMMNNKRVSVSGQIDKSINDIVESIEDSIDDISDALVITLGKYLK